MYRKLFRGPTKKYELSCWDKRQDGSSEAKPAEGSVSFFSIPESSRLESASPELSECLHRPFTPNSPKP